MITVNVSKMLFTICICLCTEKKRPPPKERRFGGGGKDSSDNDDKSKILRLFFLTYGSGKHYIISQRNVSFLFAILTI